MFLVIHGCRLELLSHTRPIGSPKPDQPARLHVDRHPDGDRGGDRCDDQRQRRAICRSLLKTRRTNRFNHFSKSTLKFAAIHGSGKSIVRQSKNNAAVAFAPHNSDIS
ncbi:hypothetical protein [Methylobacterium radiotolerans]|uniref:hypothetical protein n=1 Tax=Methylobacterium radiotolerans TaxID=31998 RepID=UPI0015C634A1|nr:hypothetical protein [Methylobacterium radiotolerans]